MFASSYFNAAGVNTQKQGNLLLDFGPCSRQVSCSCDCIVVRVPQIHVEYFNGYQFQIVAGSL